MDANEAHASLMLMLRGHCQWRPVDVSELIGVPNTKEGLIQAQNLLARLEKNLTVLELVGQAIVDGGLLDNTGEKLHVAMAQLIYITNGIELYSRLKAAASELIAAHYSDQAKMN